MVTDKLNFLFVRTGNIELARYGIEGTVEWKLSEPLGIEYCIAYLRSKGVSAAAYDMLLQPEGSDVVEDILAINPVCLGFSILYSQMMDDSYEIISALRSRGYAGHITIGGTYPTLSAEFILQKYPYIDSISRVEGELVSYNLYRAVHGDIGFDEVRGISFSSNDGRITHNGPEPLIPNLDDLPEPARDNFEKYINHGGIIQVHSSRGCHANCSFCGTAAFYRKSTGRKWRPRSAQKVVDELESLLSRTTVDEVWFTDDNFIGFGAEGNLRACQIAEEIVRRGLKAKLIIQTRADNIEANTIRALKKAGLRKVYIGIESGLGRYLTTYQKNVTVEQNISALKLIEDEGIFLELGFIGFDPYTTFAEFMENIEFIEKNCGESERIHPFAFDLLIPYRGTPIAKKLIDDGLAIEAGLDYRSIINDKKIEKAYKCVDYLLMHLGPSTEHIKALIINDETQEEAKAAIRAKNGVMVEGLKTIRNMLQEDAGIQPSQINSRLYELSKGLNLKLGIRNGLKE